MQIRKTSGEVPRESNFKFWLDQIEIISFLNDIFSVTVLEWSFRVNRLVNSESWTDRLTVWDNGSFGDSRLWLVDRQFSESTFWPNQELFFILFQIRETPKKRIKIFNPSKKRFRSGWPWFTSVLWWLRWNMANITPLLHDSRLYFVIFMLNCQIFPGFGPWSESSRRPVCPWIGLGKVTGHAWPVLNIMMIHNYERQLNICKAYIWRVLFNFLIHLRKWIPIQSHEPLNLNHLGELKMSRSITEILSQNIAVYGDREEFRGAREQTRDSKLSNIYPEIHLLSIQTVNNGLESIRRHTQIILSK